MSHLHKQRLAQLNREGEGAPAAPTLPKASAAPKKAARSTAKKKARTRGAS